MSSAVLLVIVAHGTRSFRRRQVSRGSCACGCGVQAVHRTFVLVLSGGEHDPGGTDAASWRFFGVAAPCLDGAVDAVARRGPVASRGEGYGARRLQRPAGAQRLSAHHSQPRRPLDRLHRPSRRHQGGAQAAQSADGCGGVQRHVASSTSPTRAAPSICSTSPARRGWPRTAARRWCGCATARACPRAIPTPSTCCARSATRRTRSGTRPTPAAPKLVTRLDGLKGTHKNWWECDTGIAYLVSGVAGWRVDRMTEVYDLSDPAKPVKIRDFGLLGQQPGAGGPVPTRLHGAISTGPKGNRIYFAYGTNEGGVLQIVDREKLLNGPKEPTDGEPALSAGRPARHVAADRRAHRLSRAGDAGRRVRQGQGRQGAQLRGRHQRADQERVRGAAPVRVDGGRDGGALSRPRSRPGACRRPAAASAAAAAASARTPPTRA